VRRLADEFVHRTALVSRRRRGGTIARSAAGPPPAADHTYRRPGVRRPAPPKEKSAMTACLPDDPTYCFCPMADEDGEPPQIRILVEGFIPSSG